MKPANFPQRQNQRRKLALDRLNELGDKVPQRKRPRKEHDVLALRTEEKAKLRELVKPYQLNDVRSKKNRSARAGKSQRVGF